MKQSMQGMLGKELRVLTPFTLILVTVQVLIWLILTRISAHLVSPTVMVSLQTIILVVAAALYGALFFGLEPPTVRSFLSQLPISARRLAGAKITAAVAHLLLFWGITETLAQLLGWATESPPTSLRLVLMSLAYGLCAWLSTFAREALSALVGGLVLLVLSSVVWLKLIPEAFSTTLGSEVLRLAAIAILGLTAIGLWRRLAYAEDLSEDSPWGRIPRFSRTLKPSLLALEWRQKGALFLLLLALPVLTAVLSWRRGEFYVVFLEVPLAGAALGVLLYTRPERDGTDFFLHHLPIPRWKLVLPRLATGLVFGAVLLFDLLVILSLYLRRFSPPDSFPPNERLLPVLFQFSLLFLVAFGLGQMLSPWVSSSMVGVVLALMTLMTLALVPGIFGTETQAPGRHGLLLLLAVYALAWWSCVHSRALEPGPSKNLLALRLLLPFWAVGLASLVYL